MVCAQETNENLASLDRNGHDSDLWAVTVCCVFDTSRTSANRFIPLCARTQKCFSTTWWWPEIYWGLHSHCVVNMLDWCPCRLHPSLAACVVQPSSKSPTALALNQTTFWSHCTQNRLKKLNHLFVVVVFFEQGEPRQVWGKFKALVTEPLALCARWQHQQCVPQEKYLFWKYVGSKSEFSSLNVPLPTCFKLGSGVSILSLLGRMAKRDGLWLFCPNTQKLMLLKQQNRSRNLEVIYIPV